MSRPASATFNRPGGPAIAGGPGVGGVAGTPGVVPGGATSMAGGTPGAVGGAVGGVTAGISMNATAGGPGLTAAAAAAAAGISSGLFALQESERLYNDRLDVEVAVLMESFSEIVKVAAIRHNDTSISKDKNKIAQESYQVQGRATAIVRSAESLLAMVAELKQTLLLNDTSSLAQLSKRRHEQLSNQKSAVTQRVLGLKEEVDQTIWELENLSNEKDAAAHSR